VDPVELRLEELDPVPEAVGPVVLGCWLLCCCASCFWTSERAVP
jgi:hypothetical protein